MPHAPAAAPIRVVLVDLPQMLSDIIRDILGRETDIVVAGETRTDDAELVEVLPEVDVAIVGTVDHELPPPCLELMRAHPHTRVLTVSGDARESFLYELRPWKMPLGSISPETLLEAVRTSQQEYV